MIGKAEWFQRRKYGGWGLVPKTWQGWAYIGVFIAISAASQVLPVSETIKQYVVFGLVAVILLDVLHMMWVLKKDEFEVKAEAIAERNSAWSMLTVLLIGLFYQVIHSQLTGINQVDYFLIAAVAVGAVVKSISSWWVEKRGI